jgi:hypothetical protein
MRGSWSRNICDGDGHVFYVSYPDACTRWLQAYFPCMLTLVEDFRYEDGEYVPSNQPASPAPSNGSNPFNSVKTRRSTNVK